MKRLRIASMALAALLIAGLGPVSAQLADTPWPSFQMDAQNTGMAPAGTPGLTQPSVRWERVVGDGSIWENQGNAAVGGNAVYAVSNTGRIMAIDKGGGLLWTRTLASAIQVGPALTADGYLYVGTGFAGSQNFFYKIRAADGDIDWAFEYPAATGYDALACPVVDSAGNVYFGVANPHWMYSLDPDGNVRWAVEATIDGTAGGVGGSPALSHDETVIYFTSSENTSVWALDTATGDTNWTYKAQGFFWSSGPMVGPDGTVYAGDAAGVVYALTDNGDSVTEKWTLNLGFGGMNGHLGGVHERGGNVRFYAAPNGQGFLVAVDDMGASGAAAWSFDIGGGGWAYGSPVATPDGTVYVSSPTDQNLYAVKDLGATAQLLWAAPYAGAAPGTRGVSIDSDGTLYVNSKNGTFYAIEQAEAPPPVVYTTDFDTGYVLGTIDGQDGWAVVEGDPGQALIQTDRAVSGQALCVEGTADITLERVIPNYVALGYPNIVLEYDVLLDGSAPFEGGLNLVDSMIGDAVTTIWRGGAGEGLVIEHALDAQVNIGRSTGQSVNGDAIHPAPFVSPPDTFEFRADEAEGYIRHYLDGGGAGSWWYGPYVDFYLAGDTDDHIDIAGLEFTFDTRFFQDPDTNTNPYGDAPVFVRFYTYEDDGSGTFPTYIGFRDYGIVYATQNPWNDPPYPEWTRVTVDLNDPAATEGGAFDPTRVSRMRFHGTDWSGTGDDFVDFKNFRIGPSGAFATELFADQGGDGTNEIVSHKVPGYSPAQWYRVKQVFDYQQQRLVSMTVNGVGETGPTDIFYRVYGADVANAADLLRLYLLNSGGGDVVCIDNLTVRTLRPFRITEIVRENSVRLRWNFVAPGNFVVERAEAPGMPWADVSGPLSGVVAWTDEAPPSPSAVYRVAVYDEFPASELLVEDFETDGPGWTHGGLNDSWAVGVPSDHTGTGGAPAAAFIGTKCYATNLTGNYNNDEDSWLLSPVLDLTGKVEAQLAFHEFVNTEGADFDWVILELWDSDAGTIISTLLPARGGTLGGWTQRTLSLADGIGKRVQLKFVFQSDSDIAYPGWYVDDVRVTSVP